MTDEVLERNVIDELLWDPQIDGGAIAVSADAGIVTLRGTVGSFRHKREAKRAAERVYGVRNVNNKLDAENIAVSSSHGRVTLTGSVRSWSEHDAAVTAAWSAPGIITVDDRLRVNYWTHL